ncbi:hypothetical protein PHYBOEH_011531 [Phytophthora boehmeriae]|uniref:Uncharacterized protein n=1 Tax=Phytophthora boehmeriae TaxID=109152 RepID=A0A8T1VG04_9STRA|nr:hypothetical protein PHYBOEH_011531 [Phytophthora boehmeriae]
MSTPPATPNVTILRRATPRNSGNGLSGPPGRRAPTTTQATTRRPGRYMPPESLLNALEEAISQEGNAADLRLIALREVQRARVPATLKLKLFIPAGQLARTHQLDEIMASINEETQTATWTAAVSSLCDFIRIPGRGIRFTCTSSGMAAKLGGSAIRIFGSEYIIKAASAFDRMYFVDLKNVPSDLDDDALYEYFARLGLSPLVTPTYQVGALTSRDRTLWFNSLECPKELMLNDGTALREIFFEGFSSPVFVQHKLRALNVTPPSIVKRNEEKNRERESTSPTPRPTPPADSTPPAESPPVSELKNKDQNKTGTPSTSDVLDVAKPGFDASFEEWALATSRISILNPKKMNTDTQYQVPQVQDHGGRIIFGIPCAPTSYEIAFADPDDEDDAEDTDVEVFVKDKIVSAVPIKPSPEVGKNISAHSFLEVPRTKMPRSQLRAMSSAVSKAFEDLTEPESRLATLTAQPYALQPLVNEPSRTLDTTISEHAVLRAYSGLPATTHGESTQLLPRMKVDFPKSIPPSEEILAKIYPDPQLRDMAKSYALVDLYLRVHAPLVYHDPIKIGALSHMAKPSCLQYASYVLWSDEVLNALWSGDLGEHYNTHLPDHMETAVGLITFHSNDIQDADMTENDDTSAAAEATHDASHL